MEICVTLYHGQHGTVGYERPMSSNRLLKTFDDDSDK